MTKENLIWLTKEVYRLTLLFPKKEPLRYKMRELADGILANSLRITNFYEYTNTDNQSKDTENVSRQFIEVGPLAELEVLDSFFEVAKEQNWAGISDILAIQKEYANLRDELKKVKTRAVDVRLQQLQNTEFQPVSEPAVDVKPQQPQPQPLSAQAISERQEKIMAFLREQGRAQVRQIKLILPEVTKRTLRRDFENLLKKGVIERVGERNNTFYQLKIVQV